MCKFYINFANNYIYGNGWRIKNNNKECKI